MSNKIFFHLKYHFLDRIINFEVDNFKLQFSVLKILDYCIDLKMSHISIFVNGASG